MAGMQAAEPFRDQHLDPLPDQFGAVIWLAGNSLTFAGAGR
jgi:hypothetical protein